MSKPVTFDNFAPRLKKGRVIPQGRRMIFETEDGEKQIILPIEMADAILLATGKYSMRQIIEKIFKRKGSLHFRTLFKTIHQLRDHGFLENGDDLESHSWWSTNHHLDQSPIALDIQIVKRKIWRRPRTLHFYFLGLLVIALSLISAADVPWPPLTKKHFNMEGSLWWSLVLAMGCGSLLQTGQSLIKAMFQLLLTGNMFGLYVRLRPWGIFLKTGDEPAFLITDRLFLLLYHAAVLLTPALLVWPLQFWNSQYFEFAVATAVFKFMFDLSPFTNSLFMQTVRSVLSLGQSELLSGYLRDDSLLSLLGPIGRPSFNRQMYRFFTAYILVWSAMSFWLCSVGLLSSSIHLSAEPWSALTGWSAFTLFGLWICIHVARHLKPIMMKPLVRLVGFIRGRIKNWRHQPWSEDRLVEELLKLPLFSYFSLPLLKAILSQAEVIHVRGGSRLITQGEIGRDLFVLLSGTLAVEKSSFDSGRTHLSTLRPVTIFGEMAIVEENERTADVISRENAAVLKVSSQVLRGAAKESQNLREIEAFRNAIMVNQFFTSAPMFKDLPEETVHDITMRSSLRTFAANEIIVRQGAHGRSFFMVLRGSVEVRIDDQPIKRIRQGGFFGEIALIADIPRTASVSALEPTIIMEMAAVNFWEILCQNIELAMFIEAVGESRLSEDILNGTTGLEKTVSQAG